eukprot:6488260-Amphidinium_carterae.1
MSAAQSALFIQLWSTTTSPHDMNKRSLAAFEVAPAEFASHVAMEASTVGRCSAIHCGTGQPWRTFRQSVLKENSKMSSCLRQHGTLQDDTCGNGSTP